MPLTILSKTIKFCASSNARGTHVNNREQDKLPYYKHGSCRVEVCAWGNVCVCRRQEAARDNIRRDWSTGEASESQTETTEHVLLSAAGDGFLGKTLLFV